MKRTRKQQYGNDKPKGQSRYALKVRERARLARELGMPASTPLPVLRSAEVAPVYPHEPASGYACAQCGTPIGAAEADDNGGRCERCAVMVEQT